VRGTLAPSTGPEAGERVMVRARRILASFPEVTKVVSQTGRPDDGTDPSLFSNTEYFADLKPKEQWRPVFHEDKEELIRAMNREVSKIPGALWNFSQPIADNMEEAVSGVKGELAIKIFGTDLKELESKGDEIVRVMSTIPGVQDLGLFRVIGQPNLNIEVDRARANRYGLNVADIQDAIETAVGGKAAGQVLRGEERYDVALRYQPTGRSTVDEIRNIRLLANSGERVSLDQVSDIKIRDGASQIYRENNSRYVAIKYSVRRTRPNGDPYSFPSGHASATFAFASVLERHLGARLAWPTLALGAYVATSRLHDNKHYLSDVVFGSALGTAVGWTVVGRHGRSNYAVVPGIGPDGVMFSVVRRSADLPASTH